MTPFEQNIAHLKSDPDLSRLFSACLQLPLDQLISLRYEYRRHKKFREADICRAVLERRGIDVLAMDRGRLGPFKVY